MASLNEGYAHGPAFDSGYLRVSNIHELWYAQHGNPNGKPVMFLHGGPGGNTSLRNTLFFDPQIYRVVLFDQRGAGKSRPTACIVDNTSSHLVADIETLRIHFRVPKWYMVFGGSWGSALGLMYAQAHPDKVGSLVVRGIFTGRKQELEFHRPAPSTPQSIQATSGAAMIYPEAYEDYLSQVPEEERGDPVSGYYRMLLEERGDTEKRRKLARAFNVWDYMTSRLDPAKMDWENLDDPEYCLTHALLECHYLVNGLFVEEGHLLKEENVAKMRHIPGAIVHGRYDICCAPKTAWDLHKVWPKAEFHMIPGEGHTCFETRLQTELVEICDRLGKQELM